MMSGTRRVWFKVRRVCVVRKIRIVEAAWVYKLLG